MAAALGGIALATWQNVRTKQPRTIADLGADFLPDVAQHIQNFRRVKLKDGKAVWEVKADDAQYFRGQSYTNLKDWDKAIGAYQVLVDKYPDSSFADDGLYFAAVAAQNLKNCTEARAYLGVIKTKYTKSNVTKASSDLDAAIKKDAKNKAKCTS